MIWAVLTITFYSLTAYGDKYISARLKCTPGEYTFLVSVVTVFWLVLCLPFTGWRLGMDRYSFFILACLVVWKVLEFYTTAVLLKDMEPYELKAWLGINVILSYGINLWEGKSRFQTGIRLFSLCLLLGIWLILVLTAVALIQLPRLPKRKLPAGKEMAGVVLSRLTNAAGLMTEAEAAAANIFFYTLIQPLQLFILFAACLITRRPMSRRKRAGSILCVAAVLLCSMAVI